MKPSYKKIKSAISRLLNQYRWVKRNSKAYKHLRLIRLTKNEKKKLESKWEKVNLRLCWKDFEILKTIAGFNENFIPISIFDTYILPVLNPIYDRKCLANKSMFFYLRNVPQPKSLIRCVRGIVFDSTNTIITIDQAISELKGIIRPLVFKQGIDSSGGSGVRIVIPADVNLCELINELGDTFIVQEKVKQSVWFDSFNDTSLNTIRCTTILLDDGPHLVSAQLKLSAKGAKLDNANFGSVFVGIEEDGTLQHYGYKKGLVKVFEQNGIKFGGMRIPKWNNIRVFVKSNALRLATCKVIGWDIAIGEDENPILIEANLNCPGVTIEQACSGPILGKFTDQVIQMINSQL